MFFDKKFLRLILIAVASLVFFLGLSSSGMPFLGNLPVLSTEATSTKTDVARSSWRYGSFPVENFQSYTSPFGYRRSPITGEIQFHNGLDMAAPLGSYVLSWWGGKIVKVGQDGACGTYVKIRSGTWEHVYCHLIGFVDVKGSDRYIVDSKGGVKLAQGQEIGAGTRIGRVGMTGRTTGPHLHWVLRHNGSYVDPALIIKEMFKNNA